MNPTASTATLLLVTATHPFAYAMAWAWVGATAKFATFGATASHAAGVLAASFAAALVVTAPMALLAGYVTGRRFATQLSALLAGGWLAVNFYYLGFAHFAQAHGWKPMLGELLAIAVVGVLFHRLGARLRKDAAAATPV